MVTTADDGKIRNSTDFTGHMTALERLRREVEAGDLDPVQALDRCREAEQHYRAVDAILNRVEVELEKMRHNDD